MLVDEHIVWSQRLVSSGKQSRLDAGGVHRRRTFLYLAWLLLVRRWRKRERAHLRILRQDPAHRRIVRHGGQQLHARARVRELARRYRRWQRRLDVQLVDRTADRLSPSRLQPRVGWRLERRRRRGRRGKRVRLRRPGDAGDDDEKQGASKQQGSVGSEGCYGRQLERRLIPAKDPGCAQRGLR